MLPGPDIVIACPSCKGLAKYHTVMSGNTFGARYWTDGKQLAPMLPAEPSVTRCTHCEHYYWITDAEEVGQSDALGVVMVGDQTPEWHDVDYVQELKEPEYYEAIQASTWTNREEEKELRILTWWCGNDRWRADVGQDSAESTDTTAEREANLRALAALFDETEQDELVLKAEACRELGEWEEAEGLLARVTSEDYGIVVQQIRELCDRRDSAVSELELED